jgi:hypothetical protein
MNMSEIFSRLTGSNWWGRVADQFLSVIGRHKQTGICLLYNADADGFTASYFILAVIDSLTRPQPAQVRTRAVWNYEYDFCWLADLEWLNNEDLIICVDIPVIQEPDVLRELSKAHDVLIYDHHIPPDGISEIPGVIYANSRLLNRINVDYPACWFAAALAFGAGAVSKADIPVLACGLCGDNCLNTNTQLTEFLKHNFATLLDDRLTPKPLLNIFTSRLNALFRVNPGLTPEDAQHRLYLLMRTLSPEVAFAQFCSQYNLDKAQQLVTNEVQPALDFLRAIEPSNEGLFCHVLDFRTFSVGIVASVLAAQEHAPIVALGFRAGDKVHFDLRTSRLNNIDLTILLKEQRRYFTPVTSGGHPKAAGALVHTTDVDKFRNSLKKAIAQTL